MAKGTEITRVSVTLDDGKIATIAPDTFVAGAAQLSVDGTPQSHVNLRDPSDLFFEYVRRMGHVIDEFRPAETPITALHLGGGAYTLPRFIEATRPGSRQQVIEFDATLIDFVREHMPLSKRASIRVRRGDARAKLDSLPPGLRGVVDLVVVDVFSGSTTPAHLTTVEFYEKILPFLTEDGIVLINCAAGSDSSYVRGQLATLQHVFGPHGRVAAIGEPQVLRGRRFGNIVLLAGRDPVDGWTGWLPRLLAGGPHPARILEREDLYTFIAGAKPRTDSTASPSPEPPTSLFGAS